jgi:hypothetical protein
MNTMIGLLEKTYGLLGNIMLGGMMVEGIGETAQGQDLTDPMLKQKLY